MPFFQNPPMANFWNFGGWLYSSIPSKKATFHRWGIFCRLNLLQDPSILTLSKSFTISPILFNISKYQKGNTFLLHGPWWADLVWMLSGVVSCQNISCLEHLFTDNTGMSHVKVNFGVPLNLWLIRHVLATFQTGVSPTSLSLYHRLHHSVQL